MNELKRFVHLGYILLDKHHDKMKGLY